MKQKRLICLTLLFATVLCQDVASAAEVVARAAIERNMFRVGSSVDLWVVTIRNDYEFTGPQSQAQLDRVTFQVYRKEEVDEKISDLQNLVTVLRQNLKDLADMNDALVRRLDEMEQQLKQDQ